MNALRAFRLPLWIPVLIALGFMIASAYFFRPGTDWQYVGQGTLALVIGGVLLGIGMLFTRSRLPVTLPSNIAFNGKRFAWWLAIPGVVLLFLAGESSGRGLARPEFENVSIHLQFAMFAVGLILMGWGFGGGRLPRFRLTRGQRDQALVVGAIMLFSLALRVYTMDTYARFSIDETIFTEPVMSFFNPNVRPSLMVGGGKVTSTAVYLYWAAGSVEFFGRNFFGMRMATALMGMMTIPAVYFLAKGLFRGSRSLAIIAALMIAVFPPHIQFSRVLTGDLGDPLFGTIAMACFVRGLWANRREDWAWGGVGLGLTQYFFEGGRYMFPIFILGWMIFLFINRSTRLRAYWRGYTLMIVVALLTAMPYYYATAARGLPFSPRYDDSGVGLTYLRNWLVDGISPDEQRPFIYHVARPFMVYTHHPDSLGEYYGGDTAMVIPPLIPVFLIGFFAAAWRLRSPLPILPAMLLLASAGNVLVNDGGMTARYVIIFPAIALLIAVGAYVILEALMPAERGVFRWRPALVGLVIGVIAAGQVVYYYGYHIPYFQAQKRQVNGGRDGFDAVLRVHEQNLPINTQVFVLEGYRGFDYGRVNYTLRFFRDMPHEIAAPDPATDEFDPSNLPTDRAYAFAVAPTDTVSIDKIIAAFPGIRPQYSTIPDVPAIEEYLLFVVPQPETAADAPVEGSS